MSLVRLLAEEYLMTSSAHCSVVYKLVREDVNVVTQTMPHPLA